MSFCVPDGQGGHRSPVLTAPTTRLSLTLFRLEFDQPCQKAWLDDPHALVGSDTRIEGLAELQILLQPRTNLHHQRAQHSARLQAPTPDLGPSQQLRTPLRSPAA